MSTTAIILTVASYFAAMGLLGWLSGRSGSDFYRGGGRLSGALVSIAMIGAAISGVTFVSVPGMTASKGWSYVQMCLGFVVGYWIIARLLIPLFYRHGLVSIYGYLERRFGTHAYKTGAWIFFISKLTGAGVRFLVVCVVLQALLFGPMGLPFEAAVAVSILLIWLYTRLGGVKAVIWADVMRTVCLVGSVVLAIVFIAMQLGMGPADMMAAVTSHPGTRVFYFDDPSSGLFFWKQFLAGVFMAVAMTGLDQDMMQRTLGCADPSEAGRGMIRGGIMQIFVITLFLLLGSLLCIYVESTPGIEMPERSDELFSLVATAPGIPSVVGIVFLLGLVAAAYSAAASALTALTTSTTIDILGRTPQNSEEVRPRVHLAMSVLMGLFIIAFWHLSSQDAISAVYTLASYTYGPLLGLFTFGMASQRRVGPRSIVAVCLAAPLLSGLLQWWLLHAFDYTLGFELLLVNALLTIAGLAICSRRVLQLSTPV